MAENPKGPRNMDRAPYRLSRIGRLAVLCLLAASVLQAWEPPELAPRQAAAPATFEKGVIIRLNGMITPLMGAFLERKVKEARKRGADLLIIEWDSPGGYLDTSLEMAAMLRDIGWARTVAYVPKMALSGAAIASLGCDDLLMGDNAVFGDAGPIVREWEDGAFRHAPEKVRSDLVRRVRDLAEAKGRSPALAEAMVDMNQPVYRVDNTKTGEVAYMTETDLQTVPNPADWAQGPLVAESRQGSFLEVNGKRAVELGLARTTCASRQALADVYGLSEPPQVIQSTTVDTLVSVLNSPLVTFLLFVVGLISLYIEFQRARHRVWRHAGRAVLCVVLLEPSSRRDRRRLRDSAVPLRHRFCSHGDFCSPRHGHHRLDRRAADFVEFDSGHTELYYSRYRPPADRHHLVGQRRCRRDGNLSHRLDDVGQVLA